MSLNHCNHGGPLQAPTLVNRHPPQPEVSVIVPLPNHLGLAIECLKSLVREQTYPRERFEVILMTDGADPALDSRVKELLAPEDRMICHPGANVYLLYNLGAREARGKLLFITEAHSIAEPECLEELVKFFASHDDDGACCRSVSIAPRNGWARMEERFFEEGFRTWSQPGDWRKVLLRGFAIYREIYLNEGGYEHAFNRFADWALAAKLHSRGYRLGYAAGAVVQHPFTTSPKQLCPPIRDFTRGECAYREEYPAEYCERYFGRPSEWARRESFRPSLARSVCRASLRSLWREALDGRKWSVVAAQAKTLLRFLPVALLGPRWPLLGTAWSLRLAIARCWLWRLNDRKLYRAFCDAYARMVRYSRIEYIAEQLASPEPEPPEATLFQFSEIQDKWLIGFHDVERWENESFRWSGPATIVRLRVPVGSYEVKIETRSLRNTPVPLCLEVFFNRHKVPSSSIQFDNGLLSFRVLPSMFEDGPEQRLILLCNPLRPWKVGVPDRRELGLPIFSIEFSPIREAVSGGDEPSFSTSRPTTMVQKTT